MDHGIPCIVTPPILVAQEYGNRVKTDRRDSRKLAHLLAKRLLKRVWVPSEEELYRRVIISRFIKENDNPIITSMICEF